MSKKKLTPLYPMSTPPKREGVYQIVLEDGALGWRRWLGNGWGFFMLHEESDDKSHSFVPSTMATGEMLDEQWRGLAEKP